MEELKVIEVKESNIEYNYPDGIWIWLENDIYRLLGYDLSFGGSPFRTFRIEKLSVFDGQILKIEENKILVKPHTKPVVA